MTTKDATAADRMRRLRARRRAAGMVEHRTWATARPVRESWSDHRIADVRSLVLHTLVARKLLGDPTILDKARENLDRWSGAGNTGPWAAEWREVLNGLPTEVAAFLVSMSEDAVRLRQSSPFAGVLEAEERQAVFRLFREAP